MREVQCGLAKFVLDDDDVVTQYGPHGEVVGIFSASDTPTLRQWIIEKAPKPPTGRPNGAVTQKPREQSATAK